MHARLIVQCHVYSTGTQSYMMPAAADAWHTAMTEYASPPPAYFDFHFSECYSLMLDDYNLDPLSRCG